MSKKTKRTWQMHAQHIIDCIDKIDHFREKYEAKDPEAYTLILHRELHMISESARELPDWLKEQHSNIPWDEVNGFRNRIVHAYLADEIDPALVDRLVVENLPPLRAMAEDALARNPTQSDPAVDHDDDSLAATIARAKSKSKAPDAGQDSDD